MILTCLNLRKELKNSGYTHGNGQTLNFRKVSLQKVSLNMNPLKISLSTPFCLISDYGIFPTFYLLLLFYQMGWRIIYLGNPGSDFVQYIFCTLRVFQSFFLKIIQEELFLKQRLLNQILIQNLETLYWWLFILVLF